MSRSRRHRNRFVRTVAGFLSTLLLASLCGQLCSPLYSQAAPLARAQALLKQGKAQDALELLLDLHRSQPSDANVCQQIGIAYTQLEILPEAEKFYREAVRLNPQFWAARKNLGTVLWFLDRKGESEREFLAVTKVLPADLVPHLYLGLAAYERRDFPRAKMEFDRAGTLASSNPEVLPAVFESYVATRDMSFPAKVMEQVTRAEEPDSALILRLSALFLQYGEYGRAAVALEKLVAMHKDSAEVWRMLAETYDRQGKPDQAYRAYSRAEEDDPKSEDHYIAFAEFASAHGNNDYALQVVARGLERLPKSQGLLFEQGILLALKGDREQADDSFKEASRLKPAWNLPLLALGISRLESGDATQAAILFDKSRTADPRDSRAHYLYATALSREADVISVETRAKAIAALHKAIEIDPKDARAHALLGQLDLAAGKADAAALDWQTALKIEPENATALYQLALLRRRQGKTAEAERLLQAFQRVKAKKPDEEKSLVQILRVVPEKPH
jgi:tetratricopeptide (TPR) repeat protein